jgi:hypothetical protein
MAPGRARAYVCAPQSQDVADGRSRGGAARVCMRARVDGERGREEREHRPLQQRQPRTSGRASKGPGGARSMRCGPAGGEHHGPSARPGAPARRRRGWSGGPTLELGSKRPLSLDASCSSEWGARVRARCGVMWRMRRLIALMSLPRTKGKGVLAERRNRAIGQARGGGSSSERRRRRRRPRRARRQERGERAGEQGGDARNRESRPKKSLQDAPPNGSGLE